MPNDLRNYGYGNSTKFVIGVPRIVGIASGIPACPNCGCETLYEVEVSINNPLLRGGKGIGRYVGCAACPFASPMLMAAITPPDTPPAPKEGGKP